MTTRRESKREKNKIKYRNEIVVIIGVVLRLRPNLNNNNNKCQLKIFSKHFISLTYAPTQTKNSIFLELFVYLFSLD